MRGAVHRILCIPRKLLETCRLRVRFCPAGIGRRLQRGGKQQKRRLAKSLTGHDCRDRHNSIGADYAESVHNSGGKVRRLPVFQGLLSLHTHGYVAVSRSFFQRRFARSFAPLSIVPQTLSGGVVATPGALFDHLQVVSVRSSKFETGYRSSVYPRTRSGRSATAIAVCFSSGTYGEPSQPRGWLTCRQRSNCRGSHRERGQVLCAVWLKTHISLAQVITPTHDGRSSVRRSGTILRIRPYLLGVSE